MALELNGTTGVSLVQDGVVTAADLASGAITAGALPAGSVLQVVQETVDLTIDLSTTSTSFTTASEMELAITPTKANSKIFVVMRGFATHFNPTAGTPNHGGTTTIMRSVAGGSFANVVNVDRGIDGIYRAGQNNGQWDEHVCNMEYLDTPTYTLGQQIVYRPGWRRSTRDSGGFYLNHTGGLYTYGNGLRVVGIAMEIAG